MKRLICIVVLFCLVLCGCSQEEKDSIAGPAQMDLKTFSYTEDCIRFADQKVSGYTNSEKATGQNGRRRDSNRKEALFDQQYGDYGRVRPPHRRILRYFYPIL